MYNAKVKNYQKEALKTRVAGANRYEIVQMLFAGCIEKLVLSKVAMERGHLEAKAEHISKATAIIESLRGCLDFDAGGEVCENLFSLYSYMIDKLVDASVQNDVEAINEVSTLMKEIQGAWNAIPPEVVTQTVNNSHESAHVG